MATASERLIFGSVLTAAGSLGLLLQFYVFLGSCVRPDCGALISACFLMAALPFAFGLCLLVFNLPQRGRPRR